MIKFAFETILWGSRIDDLERVLDTIADLGYQGVEIAQRFDRIGVDRFETLHKLLEERNLELLSLCFGTLRERIDFLDGFRPRYLYTQKWDDEARLALSQNHPVVLHPRAFQRISRMDDFTPILDLHVDPPLLLLPDTAHLVIAGDDPTEAIRRFSARLAAVHLKQWTDRYGRSFHRYWRGFTELGPGAVDLKEILRAIEVAARARSERKRDDELWVVVELDSVRPDPDESARICTEWLRKEWLRDRPHLGRRLLQPPKSPAVSKAQCESRFLAAIQDATRHNPEPTAFFASVAKAFHELTRPPGSEAGAAVALWACSPAQGSLGLLATWPEALASGAAAADMVIGYERSLAAAAVDSQAPVRRTHRFDLRGDEAPDLRFGPDPVPACIVYTVPIFTSGNQTYVPYVVHLFTGEGKFPFSHDELFELARAVSRGADAVVGAQCTEAATAVNLLAARHPGHEEFLRHLAGPPQEEEPLLHRLRRQPDRRDRDQATHLEDLEPLILKKLKCEGVTLFQPAAAARLEALATTGIDWKGPDKFYPKQERGGGLTARVWLRKQPLVANDIPLRRRELETGPQRSEEIVANQEHFAGLWVPFIAGPGPVFPDDPEADAAGKVIAVARCRNRVQTGAGPLPNMFFDHDAAVLDAIGQAAVPYLFPYPDAT